VAKRAWYVELCDTKFEVSLCLGACCRLRPRKCGFFQLLPGGAKINHRQEQRGASAQKLTAAAAGHSSLRFKWVLMNVRAYWASRGPLVPPTIEILAGLLPLPQRWRARVEFPLHGVTIKTLKIPHNFYMLVMCAFSFCAIDPTTVCFFSNWWLW